MALTRHCFSLGSDFGALALLKKDTTILASACGGFYYLRHPEHIYPRNKNWSVCILDAGW